jgi:acyl-CoA thioester hydrolase
MAQTFNWSIRVYIEDTDVGGVVFYANYLKFFERARTEWLRSLDVNQQSLMDRHGIIFIVKSAAVDYHAPARLDDEVTLTVSAERIGRASVQFVQEAWCGATLLATGQIRIGCVDMAGLRPAPIPAEILAKIRKVV